MLHVRAEQVIEVGLDIGEAGLQVGKREDDLVAQRVVSNCIEIDVLELSVDARNFRARLGKQRREAFLRGRHV